MEYVGKLFGKHGRRYIPMEHETEYYDNIVNKIKNLKQARDNYNGSIFSTASLLKYIDRVIEALDDY